MQRAVSPTHVVTPQARQTITSSRGNKLNLLLFLKPQENSTVILPPEQSQLSWNYLKATMHGTSLPHFPFIMAVNTYVLLFANVL
jgi:hypothetical protein